MTATEWLSAVFFSFFTALAWTRSLAAIPRLKVTALGVVGAGLVVFAAWRPQSDPLAAVFRNCLPLMLLPMAYWQTGQFRDRWNLSFQKKLEAMDATILRSLAKIPIPARIRHWMRIYVESAYLFCYPMVPSGVALLYLTGMAEHASEFWAVVLPPVYSSYATFPFVQTLPPRVAQDRSEPENPQAGIRSFNLAVLHYLSHHGNTFPSGHAAAAVAVALELTRLIPLVGMIYLLIAAGIMAGAFIGRYHFAADVLLGAALAVTNFLFVVL